VRRASACAALAAAILLAVPAARVLLPTAAAQDKDKKDKDKETEKEKKEREEREKKEREKRRREKALREIGSHFGTKNTDWLLDRVAKDQKLTLCLATGKGDVDYALDQARSVLDKYFEGLQSLSVETTSEDAQLAETTGSFPMTYRPKEKKAKPATLYVTISGLDSHANGVLTKIVVDPQ
jgi:hypothetical protein